MRAYAPRVRATDDATVSTDPQARLARLPHIAWRTAREALRDRTGVGAGSTRRVPAVGHVRALPQSRSLPDCNGPLGLANADQPPVCRWCAHRSQCDWQCDECGGQRFRAAVVGASRTAEELGRAFPGVPVVTSSAGGVLATVPERPGAGGRDTWR